jgi:hypothetical protein
MLTEPEGRIIRILDKILSYISVVIILSIFIYATFTIIDRLLSLLPQDSVSFILAENPSMPCRIENRYVVVTNTSFIPY